MQDFTVEMRVKIADLSKLYHQMVGNWTSRNFQFTYRGVSGNYFGFEDTPGWVISPYSPELNTYMHIAFVRHNNVFFCYKNGVKAQLSRLPTDEVRRTENIKIFQVYGSTGYSLIGGLYDVRFSQSAVYTDNFEINPLPLV
ncbi:MAG: LamG domain-containing protein [Gammaproteobacteria bacterium]|nr:LamG domain-containing protein [Acholeplasmataceae bacterium]MCK9529084.1 LamG domain-containing protein [Gammaproteobacteria bacterium]